MSRLTKNELIEKIKEQEDGLRRLRRTVSMAQLDLQPASFLSSPVFETKVSEHSREVIQRACSEWDKNVTEPEYGGDWQRINTYIKGVDGIGWTWEKDYTKNGQFAWCGAFAAFCFTRIKFNIRQKIFPSCYRLWNAWGGTSRKVSELNHGDIVVVYTSLDRSPSYGNHITICMGFPDIDGYFETIEGNAKGQVQSGDFEEGVIRRQRNVKDIAHIYRPASEDYDE